jgi:transposase
MHVHDHLSPDDLLQLAKAVVAKRTWLRYQAIILATRGDTAEAIARALGCSPRAVQGWVARYNRGGPQALQERPHTGRPPRLAGPELQRFAERLEAGPRPEDGACSLRGPEIRRILEREFGVALGRQATYNLLHQLGFASLMPRPQHKDANEEVQAFFKEVVVEQIEAIIEAHPDAALQVWFEDEARFGQMGTLTRVWARKGARPRAVRQMQRTSLYVMAAVCVGTGAVAALVVPELHAGVLNCFLEHVSRELPAGVHAVLIWDGAGYHTAAGLEVPGNISLILLPPYSPELNPVENLWHYLRSHHWSNRTYRDYAALEAEAIRSMRAACLDARDVKRICNAPYVSRGA